MKNQRLANNVSGFSILLPVIVLFISLQPVEAQNEVFYKLSKYELSIDLVPVIEEGHFGKFYFKIKQFKESREKGAFRVGASIGRYSHEALNLSSFPENTVHSYEKTHNFETELYFGYERYLRIGPVQTYFGADICGWYKVNRQKPETNPNVHKLIALDLIPFWGIKHYLVKNRISASMEIGWENIYYSQKNLFSGAISNTLTSQFRLPYNLTINYHF